MAAGDSGSPLLLLGNGCGEEDSLWGIVSGGVDCFDRFGIRTFAEFPGIYTRVSSFTDWIDSLPEEETIAYNNPSCSKPPSQQLGFVGKEITISSPDVNNVPTLNGTSTGLGFPLIRTESNGLISVVLLHFNLNLPDISKGERHAIHLALMLVLTCACR